MASISTSADGNRIIQFMHPDGKRRTLRLGKVPMKAVQSVCRMVEHLVACRFTGTAMPPEVAQWVGNLLPRMRDKLLRVDLIPDDTGASAAKSILLADFCREYVDRRSDLKDRTKEMLRETADSLVKFLGPEITVAAVSPGLADDWRQHLLGKGLAENTVRRRCGRAKQFFRAAIRKRLIADSVNPFDGFKVAIRANPSRQFFVSREWSEKILDACGSTQHKLVFALARWGGLRTPSETLALRWEHIDWANSRITVPSPKTAHHEGHESRQIPMFPELRPILEAAKAEARRSDFVVTMSRCDGKNFRTMLQRAIAKVGLTPWPKMFQNLRATRETELAEDYPIHVVVSWLGNSQPVAKKHYLLTTDDHFARAAGVAPRAEPPADFKIVG